MQRCELASTVLQLKAMGIDNVMKFDWLAPPPAETMIRALELLHALGALGDDARYIDWLMPFPTQTLIRALESLHALGALSVVMLGIQLNKHSVHP